jgi:hypothetical protein
MILRNELDAPRRTPIEQTILKRSIATTMFIGGSAKTAPGPDTDEPVSIYLLCRNIGPDVIE